MTSQAVWEGFRSEVYLFLNFQEKLIDLESDLEELHDSEQRWAAKQKRAIDQVDALGTGSVSTENYSYRTDLIGYWHSLCFDLQTEQLQLKLIQEKDLNEQLEVEKVSMERQVICVGLFLVFLCMW